MPLSAGLKTKCDTIVNDLATEVATKQTNYKTAKGKYGQMILTHDTIPADDIPTAPDKTKKPTDQTEDWNTFEGGISLPATMECAVCIDVSFGPGGDAYSINGFVIESGTTYRRIKNVGNFPTPEQDWIED